MKNSHRRERGLTLVELMVGIVVGMFVVAGAIATYVTTVRGNTETLRSTRLNQEMRAVMDLMVNDIRRAGYWGDAANNTDTGTLTSNPFALTASPSTNIAILNGGSCVLFSYDRSSDGLVDAAELYGIRLDSNPSRIRMRLTGANTSDCSDGTWEDLTDSQNIANISLTFAPDGSQCLVLDENGDIWESWSANSLTPCASTPPSGSTMPSTAHQVEIRQLQIVLGGTHPDDPSITKELIGEVKIRNDRVIPAP